VGQEKNLALKVDHLVLCLFCSTVTRRSSITKDFVHTLLSQILSYSPVNKGISVVRNFLLGLLDKDPRTSAFLNWNGRYFTGEASSYKEIEKLLDSPAEKLLAALETVLRDKE